MTQADVIDAIMRRNPCLSLGDAEDQVLDMQVRINQARRCGMMLHECSDIIADNLGLEPDYLEAFT